MILPEMLEQQQPLSKPSDSDTEDSEIRAPKHRYLFLQLDRWSHNSIRLNSCSRTATTPKSSASTFPQDNPQAFPRKENYR